MSASILIKPSIGENASRKSALIDPTTSEMYAESSENEPIYDLRDGGDSPSMSRPVFSMTASASIVESTYTEIDE